MIYRYKTVMIEGHPDAILSAQSVEGWELVTVTVGGFNCQGRHMGLANVLWLRRPRDVPADDLVEEKC